jgi:hypothetical protein
MTAARALARVREVRPDVAELARAVSIAAQVDVGLVRRIRLRLLPGADVSTETALWTSNLVQGRAEHQLELRDDVRAELWRELGEHRDQLDRARAALAEVRTAARPLLRLEEELIYCGIVGDLARIDAELRAVIVAMRDAPERRRNLAAWAARVLELVPALARQTEAARILGSVASAWVATSEEVARLQPDVDSLPIVHLLQPDTTRVAFHVERIGDELVVGTAPREGAHVTIDEVLASNPVLVIDQNRTVRLDLAADTRIPVQGARVRLGTLDQRQWWLEPAQAQPPTSWILRVPGAGDAGPCAMYLVSPDHAVSCARIGTAPFPLVVGEKQHGARIVAVDEDADIALLELAPPTSDTPYDLRLDVDQGQAWQAFAASGARVVGTVATAWPGVTLRLPEGTTETLLPGTPIFVGEDIIGHVRAVPPTADGYLHTTSARLIRWWVDQASDPTPAEDLPQPAGAGPASPPSIWVVTQRRSAVETFAPFEPRGGMAEDDLVLLMAQIDTRPEVWRPAAIYRWSRVETKVAQQGTRSAPGNTLQGRLVFEIPLPESPSIYDERLQEQLRPYRALADQTLQQAGVHDEVYKLLRSFSADPAYQDQLAALFGVPPSDVPVEGVAYAEDAPVPTPAPAPVRIELPDRISTGGLLGVSLATEGALRRFRRHQWRAHPVEIVAAGGPTPATPAPETLLVNVTTDEVDPTTATMELAARLFRNPGKDAFYAACAQAAQGFACEVIRGPKRGGSRGPYDLELVVNRMPGVSAAHASRRAVQFVTAVLDQLDHPDAPRTVVAMQSYGATGDDLVEAQRTVDALGIPGAVLTWIDLEGGVVDLRFDARGGPPKDALYRIAAALGDETLGVYPRAEWPDPLAYRFGIARQRNHRRLDLDGDPADSRARMTVRGVETDRPVIGHVAFYVTDDDGRKIRRVRVRAADGIATCEVTRRARGFAVGAIIEDEGILLEQFVEPPTRPTQRTA